MGNKVCCQETRTQEVLEKYDVQISKSPIIAEPKATQSSNDRIEIPELLPKVKQMFDIRRFFHQQEQKQTNPQIRRYGQDVYVGLLDSNCLKPNGIGRMYKADGSLYIGFFNQGNAHGKGAFIFTDGSFYYGGFANNTAQTQEGTFQSQTLVYTGGFKNSKFEGQGAQTGKQYIFEGWFHNGFRTKGTLQWQKGTHIYTGTFNQHNKFHGKGKLIQPQGTYQGDFNDGEKDGKGVYLFKNGTKYEGDYVKGYRQGHGTIYHGAGDIAYVGQMKRGLPDGKGVMMKDKKGLVETTWIQGIDASLLPQVE